MKKTFKYILKHLLNWIDVLESLLFILIIGEIWGILIGGVLGFIALRRHFRVWKSKQIIKEKLINERVAANEGAQGAGKTSLMLYMTSLEYKANEVYTIVPCKINGEFTNKLTKEITSLQKRVPLHSCFLFDEISMYYSNSLNMKDIKNQELIKPLEITFQSIRHFTDGNVLGTSVDMCRVNKNLEEKHSIFNKLLKQTTCHSSYVILPLYKLFLILTKKYDKKKHKYLGTYRVWTIQTFRPITHDNYYYDLSNQDEQKTKNEGYSNLLEIWAYNNLDYEYNDTYLRRLYETLPPVTPEKWDNLEIDRESLNKIGHSDLVKYFPTFK